MHSTDIRSTFLDFFAARDHRVVPSSPLIPSDPTLLLTNAGMNQFKPYFLGETTPEHPRATSVQKCARTSDIENVGRTTRHATFFEMLGNFSFGDYFKAETIAWAWELFTRHFNLDPERIWITVYEDDDEAERLWRRIGVPAERVQRMGMADSYWSMGVPGPCGPASDLNYDRGPAFGREGGPSVDGERYVELWSLVFMQNRRGEGPAKEGYPILGELPAKSIDTGLGLDRLAAILQGVDTVCETDLLAPALRAAQELAGREYPGRDGSEESLAFRVVTEHARTVAYLIADGVMPSRDGRGYVLRRLMRRAIRHARLLGIDGPALPTLTAAVVDTLSDVWPELGAHRSLIERVVTSEEEGFDRTLRQGSRLLDAAIGRTRSTGAATLPGETAFELHDTYGFPIDLTVDAARSAGLTVDEDRFAVLLDEQQRRAKRAGRGRTGAALARMDAYRRVSAEHGLTAFVGYGTTEAEGTVIGLLRDGAPAAAAGEGDEVEVLLDRSPFYAEAGGQVGDTGVVRTASGAVLEVTDTRLGIDGVHVHTARVTGGEARSGERVEAIVDAGRRAAVARSHSATHVLHAMLRRTIGDHAEQRGSLVRPGQLRFDFAHFAAVDPARLGAVQALVNDHLLADPEVRVWQASRAEAEAAGATALFGERYGETVRVVDIGDFSRELCGGTHVGHGSMAGPVHILGESSIGAGLRRIEALTGADALRHYDHEHALLTELTGMLGVRPEEVSARLRGRLDALAEAQAELRRLREAEFDAQAERLARDAEPVAGGWLVADRVRGLTAGELRSLAGAILEQRHGPGIVVLGTESDGKALLVSALTPGLYDDAGRASEILRPAAALVGGGAGGSGALASAGGRRPERLGEALAVAAAEARSWLSARR